MTISVEIYRASIGLYYEGHWKVKKYKMKKSKTGCKYLISQILAMFFLGFSLVAFNLYLADIQFKQQVCLKYPTSFLTKSALIINYNFLARYTFGNKRQSGLKICRWNGGSSYLVNKVNEIETIMSNYRPHILGISESCFSNCHSADNVKFSDYKVVFAKTLDNLNLNVSRVSLFVHNDVQWKIRQDLMSEKFSSIWVEIGHCNQKKILVCNLYREWQYLNQTDDRSKSVQAQFERWQIFISQWEKALNENREVVVLGDVNLDFLQWKKGIHCNPQAYRLRDLSQLIFDRIIPHGVVQCITEATHFWPGREPSGLDHIYSNHPEKLSRPLVINNGASDHRIIMCTRYTKQVVSQPRIMRKRSFKHFDSKIFLQEVRDLPMWKIYSCDDPEIAVGTLSLFLTNILDKLAPVKIFQVRKNYCPWLTDETKCLIQDRNLAQIKAIESGDSDNWKLYKKL